jgi:hypothetical protein
MKNADFTRNHQKKSGIFKMKRERERELIRNKVDTV